MVCPPKVSTSLLSEAVLGFSYSDQLRDDRRRSLRGPSMALTEREEAPAVSSVLESRVLVSVPGIGCVLSHLLLYTLTYFW